MAAEKRLPRLPPVGRRAKRQNQGKSRPLDPIKNRVLLTSLRVAPWLAVLVIGSDLLVDLMNGALPLGQSQVMFLSGIAAVAMALVAFLTLMQRIEDAFGALWRRNVVVPTEVANPDEPVASPRGPAQPLGTRAEQWLKADYQAFLDHLHAVLNSQWQWVLGISFALLVFSWSPGALVLSVLRRYPLTAAVREISWYVLAAVVVEAFVAFVVGTMVWRMTVVGVEVSRLGTKFGLRPQLGHPDRCGGLEPLGDLCLWNALIISIAGVYLGGWIIILRPGLPADPLAVAYVPLFLELLGVPVVVAAMTFFLPLWNIHQIMLTRRAEIRQKLDELGQSIDRSARELLDRADELVLAEGEEKSKRLELMQQTYQQCRDVPVWPFNVQTLIKFVSSQAVPLLALTGLSEPIRDVLKSVFGALQG